MSRAVEWAFRGLLVMIAVTGCSAQLGPDAGSSDALSSSMPSPAATATPLADLPLGMQHRWVREPRPIAGVTKPPIAATLELGTRSLSFYGNVPASAPEPVLGSTLGVARDGNVEMSLDFAIAGCQLGDRGRYVFVLNPSGLGLTVSAISDSCSVRADAVAGAWVRAECPTNPRQWCLGDLDPGSHVSVNYLPFGHWKDWAFEYGRFRYTVPTGWTNFEDNADGFVLAPRDAPDGAGVFLFTDPRAHAQGPDCPHELAPGVDGSAAALVRWLRGLPGLDVTNVKATSIGGISGTVLDLKIRPGWTRHCPWDPEGSAGVPLLLNADHEDFDWGLGLGGRMRLFVLALEPGRALVVDIEAANEADWQALIIPATPIVQSFEFHH